MNTRVGADLSIYAARHVADAHTSSRITRGRPRSFRNNADVWTRLYSKQADISLTNYWTSLSRRVLSNKLPAKHLGLE